MKPDGITVVTKGSKVKAMKDTSHDITEEPFPRLPEIERQQGSRLIGGKDSDKNKPRNRFNRIVVTCRKPRPHWGWVVVLAAFVANFILAGIHYSIGLYYQEWVDYFEDNTKSEVSWIGSINLGLSGFSGPVTGIATARFGSRTIVMTSAIVISIGLSTSAIAPNVIALVVTFGIIPGLGISFIFICVSITPMYYFKEGHSGLPLGLAMSGCGCGAFLMPLIIEQLIDLYGWRGSLFFLSGLTLQCCVCGALLREPMSNRSNQDVPAQTLTQSDDSATGCLDLKQMADEDRSCVSLSEHDVHGNGICLKDRRPGDDVNGPRDFQHTESQCKTDIDTLTPENNSERTSSFQCACAEKKGPLLDTTILRNVPLLLFLFGHILFTTGLSVYYIHLPNLLENVADVGRDISAKALSATGIANFVGRIVHGALAGIKCVNISYQYCICYTIGGATLFLLPHMTSVAVLLILAAVFGFTVGPYLTITQLIMVRLAGLDNLKYAHGVMLFLAGIGWLIGAPIAGLLYDTTEDYTISIYFGGVVILVSVIFMIQPALVSCRAEQQQERKPNNGTRKGRSRQLE